MRSEKSFWFDKTAADFLVEEDIRLYGDINSDHIHENMTFPLACYFFRLCIHRENGKSAVRRIAELPN